MSSLPVVGGEWAGCRMRAVLGGGEMSVVYKAEHPRLGSFVALKVLAPELATDDVFRATQKDGRLLAMLNGEPHDNAWQWWVGVQGHGKVAHAV